MLRVCIISPGADLYSETFIKAHIQRLPANVLVLYGGALPSVDAGGGSLINRSLLPRIGRAVMQRAFKPPDRHFEKKALQRYLARNRVDVVLAEYGPTGAEVSGPCAKAGVPLVVHFHGYDAYKRDVLAAHADKYQSMFSTARAVIAVSRDMENRLLELGAPRERLFYNPCGADVALFKGADPTKAPRRFIAVGRFMDKKAPHLALLSFAEAMRAHADAALTMVGDGPLLNASASMAKALGIAHAVELTGALPHAEVARRMAGCRGFLQHSITAEDGNSEGTPVAVLEAGAAGLPVVATRHAGIRDVVIHEETGLLVEEHDIVGMARCIEALIEDPVLAASLGRRARERIEQEFSMDKSIGNLFQILQDASL